MRHVVDAPRSSFAEGIRAIKVAADLQGGLTSKVIGVTSTLPAEGKTTVVCNFALLLAHAGKRVVLIDADLRRPTLIRSIDPAPAAGLADLLAGKADLATTMCIEATTGLALLPSPADREPIHTDEMISSAAFEGLITRLRNDYDFVVLDLPPIGPVVDVRAAARLVDSIVLVVEWARTRINVVTRQLDGTPEVRERLLGVVLNKAEPGSLLGRGHYYGGDYRAS
jgi:succinoglycan biosynthesis transport protein ExoP